MINHHFCSLTGQPELFPHILTVTSQSRYWHTVGDYVENFANVKVTLPSSSNSVVLLHYTMRLVTIPNCHFLLHIVRNGFQENSRCDFFFPGTEMKLPGLQLPELSFLTLLLMGATLSLLHPQVSSRI